MKEINEQIVNSSLAELIVQCKGTMNENDYPSVEALVKHLRLFSAKVEPRLVVAALLFLLIETEDRISSETSTAVIQ